MSFLSIFAFGILSVGLKVLSTLNAGVYNDYTKFLYSLAVKMLVGHWYENRSVVGKADKLAFSLDTIILQLKYTQVEPVV